MDCRLYFHFRVAVGFFSDRELMQNGSHVNDLIFMRMNEQVTYI